MLQNAGNHPETGIREARIAPSECPSYNPCTLCMDAAPRASDSPTLCSDSALSQECRKMPNVSARVLNLVFAVADAQAVVVAGVVALVLAVCLAFGARWITAQGE